MRSWIGCMFEELQIGYSMSILKPTQATILFLQLQLHRQNRLSSHFKPLSSPKSV